MLVVDIGIAQTLLNRPGQVSRLLVGKVTGKAEPLENVVGDELHRIEPDAESDLERLTDSFHLNLTAFGLLSFMVGLFIVNSAIGLAFEQRLPILRTLRACGISAKLLNTVLVIELVSLAVVAGLFGMVLGYLIAAALLPDVAASLRGLYGAPIPGELSLRPEWWIAGLAVSVAGALAAATTSLVKAFRLPVLAVAQPQAWREAQSRWLIVQSALALIAFAIAAWLLFAGNSLISGFALLAALLIGAALILPAILDIALHAGERIARGALVTWFWADSRQQLPGFSLALMALLLALAVNVGVATMVETFSKTFLTWLDGRLTADVFLTARDNAHASAIKAWLRQRSEVQAILTGGRAETQTGDAADRGARPARSRDLSRALAAAANGAGSLEQATRGNGLLYQRAIVAANESFGRRPHRRADAEAATGGWISLVSMPTTATPRARSRSMPQRCSRISPTYRKPGWRCASRPEKSPGS